jgi:regulator of extracellular matrix RemA (YlzA/DUF370 family)
MKKIILLMAATALTASAAFAADTVGEGYPPNAEPGSCYARCNLPALYETTSEQVVVKEASTRLVTTPAVYRTVSEQALAQEESKRLEVIPAVYETKTEQVLVKEASKKIIVIPATYEVKTEQVLAKEASKRLEVIPATYETVTEKVTVREPAVKVLNIKPTYEYEEVAERVMVAPASSRWEKGKASAACLAGDPAQCNVMCLVEVPAQYRTFNTRKLKSTSCGPGSEGDTPCTREEQLPGIYKTVSRKMVKTPASTREVEIPATYKTVTHKVIAVPASTREEEIPAIYKTVTQTVLKTPASTREVLIPATYKTVTRTVVETPAASREETIPALYETVQRERQVTPGSQTQWTKVLCQSDITSERIRAIQAALKEKGYDPGPIDNRLGAQTKAAISQYQRDNKLPQGSLDFKTLESLGVSVN